MLAFIGKIAGTKKMPARESWLSPSDNIKISL
jgi:hypothetical protein